MRSRGPIDRSQSLGSKCGKLEQFLCSPCMSMGYLGAICDKLCIKCMLDMKKVGNDCEIRVHKVNR